MTERDDIFTHPASQLALEVFRLNGALIAAGDALVAPLGLTSAQWQVLGAIAEAKGDLPVAGIARNMGLVRQSVQRIVNNLAEEKLVELVPNPHHRRAKLVRLTPKGEKQFEAASARWRNFAEAVIRSQSGETILHLAKELQAFRDAVQHIPLPETEE